MWDKYFINGSCLPTWHTKYGLNNPVDVEYIWAKYQNLSSTKLLNTNQYLPVVEGTSNQQFPFPSWTTAFSTVGYFEAAPAAGILSGTFPKYNQLGSDITDNTTIVRTNDTLTIGSTVYHPSDFDDNVIPKKIVVVAMGAGGAGGTSYSNTSQSPHRSNRGGGGGSGAFVGIVMDLENNATYTLNIGKGGKCITTSRTEYIWTGQGFIIAVYYSYTLTDPTSTTITKDGSSVLIAGCGANGGSGTSSSSTLAQGGRGGIPSTGVSVSSVLFSRYGDSGGNGGEYWGSSTEYDSSNGVSTAWFKNKLINSSTDISPYYQEFGQKTGGTKGSNQGGGGGAASYLADGGSGGRGSAGGDGTAGTFGSGGGGAGEVYDIVVGYQGSSSGNGGDGLIRLYY